VKPSRYIPLLAAAFLAGGLGVWLLSRDGDSEPSSDPAAVELETEAADPSAGEGPSGEEQPGQEDETAVAVAVREVQRAVRRYVEAIDGRDGVLLCGLVGGIADLDLPVPRPSCAESVSESIGYRDPRGIPVFESAVVTGPPEVRLDGGSARATVTVVTEFADRDEPSVEDDVIYLVRRGGEWLIVKPSSTLYRAIGAPDAPPDVIAPPE
jgi:hypothetical protein